MPIEFACESCAKLLRVPDGTQGQSCQCPACAAILEIPDPKTIGMVEVVERETADRRLAIACPRCTYHLDVDPKLLGTKGQCRNCKYIFLISTDPDEAGTAAEAQITGTVFSCPRCNQLFEGKEEMRGRKGKCHTCGEVFPIELRQLDAPETPTIKMRRPAGIPGKNGPVDASPKSVVATPLQLACPACQGVMEVPAEAAGQTTACPYCKQLLQIPGKAGTQLPSASPRAQFSAAPTSRPPSQGRTLASSAGKTTPSRRLKAPHSASERGSPAASVPGSKQGKAGFGASAVPGPRQKPTQADQEPQPATHTEQEDIWADLGDLSGAASINPYEAVPQDLGPAVGNTWDAPKRRVSGGLTFHNAFSLAFERAFPECLTAIIIYMMIGTAAAVVSYGSLFALSWALAFAGIDPDTGFIVVCVALVAIGLICIALGTAGLCMICNGGLVTIRRKRADASDLFSTGGVFMPMLVYLFVASLVAAILGSIPYGVAAVLGAQNSPLILLAALCVAPLSLSFGLGTCLAPLAIVDGEGPFDAMMTSVKIVLANPLAMLGILFVAGFGYLIVTVFTCGLGGIILAGFPYYLLAACYHLATR